MSIRGLGDGDEPPESECSSPDAEESTASDRGPGNRQGSESASDDSTFTDLDRELLSTDDHLEEVDLDPEDFTDLDDALLYFHRDEELRDRYGPIGLTAVTLVHFLPALIGLLPGYLGIDTSLLAPSIGLDLFFATGIAAFFSGTAAHIAREYGSRYLLRYGLAAIIGGSLLYLGTLANAALAPGTVLTSGGLAAGIFPQLNAGVMALSIIGGLLVATRIAYEFLTAD